MAMILQCERSVAVQRAAALGGLIAAGDEHSFGVRADGHVLVTEHRGYEQRDYPERNVSYWRDITAVATAGCTTLGLKADGRVLITDRRRKYDEVLLPGWSDVVAISMADGPYSDYAVGLRRDGTVLSTGEIESPYDGALCGPGDLSGWRDIAAVAVSRYHTVGLRSDGTVVTTAYSGPPEAYNGQCELSQWRDMVAIAAARDFTLGLHADGTVRLAGRLHQFRTYNTCYLSEWRDIIAIASGEEHALGLRADGIVLAAGYDNFDECAVRRWSNVVAISAGRTASLGLRADGTVLGSYCDTEKSWYHGQHDVNKWRLFQRLDTLEEERSAAAEKAQAQKRERIAFLKKRRPELEAELSQLHGFFTAKRRKELEARLAAVEHELRRLEQ